MPPGTRTDMDTTLALIARAKAGDADAIDRLVARHRQPLRRWARGRLPAWARQLADTDDLVQDALLQTFKRIGEFEPDGAGAFQAYLRQAVLNRMRDELRRHGRLPPLSSLDSAEVAETLAIDASESPLEQAIGRENLQRYEQALERLRPEEREAVIARIEMGCTYPEIADALGKPSADAARKTTARALVRLAEEMRHVRS
jgi:RNA polymerase sigma-70 factor (ECF subfamily)